MSALLHSEAQNREAKITRPPPVPSPATHEEVCLLPGKMLVSAQTRRLNTLLGSCVAVCIWDEGLRIGGMNHYLLPERVLPNEKSGRYGKVAGRTLVEQMQALGSRPENMRAKIFGGGRILKSLNPAGHLGLRNIETALRMLRELGVQVTGMDVGGDRGRRLSFFTEDGQAWVKYIAGENQ